MITRTGHQAFSLVEVVLSVGIISFALAAVLGLLSVGFSSDRSATDDTLLPVMTRKVVEHVRAEAIPNARDSFYFDTNGELQTDGSGTPLSAPSSDTVYTCALTRVPETTLSGGTMIVLRLDFHWPSSGVNASTVPATTVHASFTQD